MVGYDPDEMKKLSPEDRIRRLKKIAEKSRDDIKKAQQMIKKSEAEIAEAERKKKEMPIPEIRAVDISSLFSKGVEEQILKNVKERENLTEADLQRQRAYQIQLARELSEGPAVEIYNAMKQAYEEFKEVGYFTSELFTTITAAKMATQEKIDSINAGDYLPSQEVTQALVASVKIGKFMQDKYRG